MTDTMSRLSAIITHRKAELPAGSYTTQLFTAGENEIVKKLGEEAIEVIVAAKAESDDRLVYEMADLVYHALVLLAARDLAWQDVEDELARRFR